MSIHWPILRALVSHPLKVVITDDQRSYRAIDLLIAAQHVAAAIQSSSQSRHIGILLPTGGAFPIAALACWIAGRVPVPLNYLLKPEELCFVINDCGADAIITATGMLDFVNAAAAKSAGSADWLPPGVSFLRMDALNFRSFPDLRWPALAQDDDLGVLLYTSGTSGKPKGVMLTHGNIQSNIQQVMEAFTFDDRDTVLGVLPQFHTFGLTVLTLLPLTVAAKSVFTARFMPNKLVRLMREHRPTVFIAIPSMYNALLHAKDARPDDFASLRIMVSGGEPLPNAVADAFRNRFGVTITEGYGLTETSPVTNACLPHHYRPHSVGPPIPRVRERIVDLETGEDLPPGKDGEIRITGPNIMRGYYQRPEETAAAFDDQGWLRTGDIGRFDDDGHLYITGRLKEMLIIGGENVFPREIEEVLNAHPAVKDSGVIGKPDPMRGELPVAFIELKDPAHGAPSASSGAPSSPLFDPKPLLAFCRQRLANYKVPDEIRVVESLPRNPTGKVMRRELKKLL